MTMGSGVLLGRLQLVVSDSFKGSLLLSTGVGGRSSIVGALGSILLTDSLSFEQDDASMDFLLFLPLFGVLSCCLPELEGVILPLLLLLLWVFFDELVSLPLLPLHELELD